METQIKHGVSRFANINGVTCYMNSILHILQQMPIFADYIYHIKFADVLKQKMMCDSKKIKDTIIYAMYSLFTLSMNNDDKSITPYEFKKIIGKKNDIWTENIHQDSQEFFNFIISSLEDEIGTSVEFIPGRIMNNESLSHICFLAEMSKQKFQNKEFSILKPMFNGLLISQIRCKCCSNISNDFEPFINLQLSIPYENITTKQIDLTDCLDLYTKEEQFDKDNMYSCDFCGLKNRGFKTTSIWETPKILVIQIKRFKMNNYGIITQKLKNNINYPICDFDISKYMHIDSPHKSKSKYDLIGINTHIDFGGIHSGHYVSTVKSKLDNNWYLYNDNKAPIKILKKMDLQDKNAYLLFYYRKD
jgi:ubiquitin C-terminal hydrolase